MLSSRNPNVLFKLGIRQAFDKPVVLIQETGTPKIFDITPLRYLEYSKEMKYHDVLKSQTELKDAILATVAADADAGNVNSIVKLLALNNAARIPEIKGNKENLALGVIQAEMQELRKILQISLHEQGRNFKRGSISAIEFERIASTLERIQSAKQLSPSKRMEQLDLLMQETQEIAARCDEKSDSFHFQRLMERIHYAIRTLN